MLISDEKEFIFVHIFKTGGESIRHALKPYATYPNPQMSWMKRQWVRLKGAWKPDCSKHLTAREIRERYPERWKKYFTFAFVRNPFSWQVSIYFYTLQTERHKNHEKVKKMSGFKEWLMQIDEQPSQESFLVDDDGDIILDYVGRTEKLGEHFADVCDHLGIEASLGVKNSSDHKEYTEYYDEEAAERVKRYCNRDIEKMGYSFGGSKEKKEVKSIDSE